ncbi:hypothetical protein [Undibacterium sp. Ren11W]|uniref:hypothetical protein n=1 Tax=Undibacterium sp. Ren11W TaxID=3413045 RepID=UPI003BF44754
MTKKSLLLALLLSTTLISAGFCQELISMAMSAPASTQEMRAPDTLAGGSAATSSVMLDRSGMDKASVHLQILQQSTAHFAETTLAKKPLAEDKKSASKPQGNS